MITCASSWQFCETTRKSTFSVSVSGMSELKHFSTCWLLSSWYLNFKIVNYNITQFIGRDKTHYMGRVKRIWYLSPMRAAKVQASLRIRAVSPEPPLLAHTSSESRGTFRQKARSLAPLNGWVCAVKICHDGMLKDTNSLDAAHKINHGNVVFNAGCCPRSILMPGGQSGQKHLTGDCL